MVNKVLWSDFALNQLKQIHNYITIQASKRIAARVVSDIVKTTIYLEKNPTIGRIEPLLEDRKYEYRFLVKKKHKIIYRVDNNIVRIISVFDTRQNPKKIKTLK